jgi:hypothetical protein
VGRGADAAAHPFRGAGGDPQLLAALRKEGVDLARIGRYPLLELRQTLERCAAGVAHRVLVFRGRVRHNVTRRGVGGFVVTPLGSPAPERAILRSVAGEELVPAITDRAGCYTLVGLPREVELTNVLERPGFLELAYTARTSYPADYLQDYVGTVPRYLIPPGADGSSSAEAGLGALALTIVFERSAPDASDFGFVTEGKYESHGVPGVSFRLSRVPSAGGPGTGTMSSEPIEPAQIVYADTVAGLLARRFGAWTAWPVALLSRLGLRRILHLLELPAPDRSDTSALGLALVSSLPEGLYELEARHPSLECVPTRDSWPAPTPRRCRAEVVAGKMGDVRFFCTEPGYCGGPAEPREAAQGEQPAATPRRFRRERSTTLRPFRRISSSLHEEAV